ncbi:hypothetical protein BH10ACT2_BH10ACT2_13680 [soil metagenome]
MKRAVLLLPIAWISITACSSSPSATTTTSATTLPACDVSGGTDAKVSGEPVLVTPLVGIDILATSSPCYEDITIRFNSSTDGHAYFPGWAVSYVDDPVYKEGSSARVDIAGAATLLIQSGAWMPNPSGEGYSGPVDITPTGVSHILQLLQVGNHAGVNTWAVGLDAQYPFTVTVPDGPARIVVRIQVGG